MATRKDRAALIAGLRGLADFLESPAVPLAWFAACVSMPGEGTNDAERRAFVDRVAAALGTTTTTDPSGHYRTCREFGPVEFGAFMIPAAAHARYEAENSYRHSVRVDDEPVAA